MEGEAEGRRPHPPVERRPPQQAGGHGLKNPPPGNTGAHAPEDTGVEDVEGAGEEAAREDEEPGVRARAAITHGPRYTWRVPLESNHGQAWPGSCKTPPP